MGRYLFEGADVVVIGTKQTEQFRWLLRRLFEDPTVYASRHEHLDCKALTVSGEDE